MGAENTASCTQERRVHFNHQGFKSTKLINCYDLVVFTFKFRWTQISVTSSESWAPGSCLPLGEKRLQCHRARPGEALTSQWAGVWWKAWNSRQHRRTQARELKPKPFHQPLSGQWAGQINCQSLILPEKGQKNTGEFIQMNVLVIHLVKGLQTLVTKHGCSLNTMICY